MKKDLLFLTLMVATLSGCSSYEGQFECEPGVGMGCKSISQVNALTEVRDETLNVNSQPSMAPVVASPFYPSGVSSGDGHTSIHRISEERLKVWIAPFQDEQGNFHEASVIHTVIRPGYWQISDMGALSPDSRFLTPEPGVW